MNDLAMVAAAGVGTLLLRSSLVVIMAGTTIPPRIERGLRLVAPAVLAGLVAQGVLVEEVVDEQVFRSFGSWHLAALIAGAVALKTRSVALTLAIGMTAVLLLEAVI